MKILNYSTQLILLAAGLLILSVATADAQRGRGNFIGMGQELVKPDIVELSGELVEIKTGPCEQTTGHALIGTHLFIRENTDGPLMNIHLGDANAVDKTVAGLVIGHQVNIQAFRTDLLDNNHYIAMELESDGRSVVLRTSDFRPVWAGSYGGRRGRVLYCPNSNGLFRLSFK